MESFSQSLRDESRRYTFVEEGLESEIKSNDNATKFLVKYENILFDSHIQITEPNMVRFWLVCSLIVNVLLILYFIFGLPDFMANPKYAFLAGMATVIGGGVVFMIVYQKWQEQYSLQIKVLHSNPRISFLYHEKEQSRVDEFLKELKNRQKAFLRKKYMKINEFISPEEHREIFLWLRQLDYITEDELHELMEDLNRRSLFGGRFQM